MKTFPRCLAVLGLLAGTVTPSEAAEPGAPLEKKIIYHGWSTRDSAYVSDHWQEMEQMPFDGVGISIALDRSRPTIGNGSTGNLLGWQAFGSTAFPVENFREAIRDLQQPAWTRFTDNFLPVAIATRDQDQGLSWFDDRRWATIENNWRVLLKIAKEGRCRGLLLDPEHYDYECELFNYRHHSGQRDRLPFERYAAQARARGRKLGAALREIYPQITIGLLYGYNLPSRELGSGEPPELGRYALLPAFLDGLLEASAPEATFVDLWEFGHGYQEGKEFSAARTEIRRTGKAASSNPAAYEALIQIGMSLRIDTPRRGSPWQPRDPERNHFSPARFERALRGALQATDRYVWIYSEDAPRFFPPALLPPLYLEAIQAARHTAGSSRPSAFALISVGLVGMAALGVSIPLRRRARRAKSAGGGSMRILLVTGIFPPDRGGPASYVPKVAEALVRRGHSVEVISLSDRMDHKENYRFGVRRIRRRQFWPVRILRTVLKIWRAARRHDLVYVNGLGAEAALAALLARRPAVHKVVGDYAWERAVGWDWYEGTLDEYQTTTKSFELRLIDAVRTWPLRLAQRIIVPSRYLSRIISGWGIAREKIEVIRNATVASASAAAAPALPLWTGKTLMTACRLVPWKGVKALIRLLPELPATRLVIAGDGHLRGELEAFARSISVATRVIFLGDVSPGEVAGYFAQADAFVLNSSYEGLPHVVLEAMAVGTPVIATHAGGTGEAVEHNVSGLLVPVGDRIALRNAIELLWRDPAFGRQLAEEASARLRQHFDFDAMVAATEETLRGAVAFPGERKAIAAEVAP